MWGVRRSIRYHLRRRKFFDQLGFVTNFLTIISGGGAIVSAGGDSPNTIWVIVFGSAVAILSAIDLVVGSSIAARDHHDLARRFSELERDMTSVTGGPSERQLVEFTNRRLELEEDEPPVLRVLDADCHNELVKALDIPKSERVKILWFQSLLMHVVDVLPDRLEKIGDAKPPSNNPLNLPAPS